MSSFFTTICDPATSEPVRVEVFYSMRDTGVTMQPQERVRAVIHSVALDTSRDDGAPLELLGRLNNEDIVGLAEAASGHWQDQMDLSRWGSEVI